MLASRAWSLEFPAMYSAGVVMEVVTDPDGVLSEHTGAFGYARIESGGATYSTSQFSVDVIADAQ